MGKFIKIVILLCCVCFMCYFAYNIYNYFIEEKENDFLIDDLRDNAFKSSEKTNQQDLENEEKTDTIKIDFEVLKERNSDIIGWIYSKNTPINYPVVQSYDNDFYLRRLIDGSYNRAGTIFMDYRCNKDFSDWNTILYGHNMKNNSMFGTLINYKEQSYYDEHKVIYYFTEKKNYEIVLIAGYTDNSDSKIYNIPVNENDKERIISNAKSKSTFNSGIEVTQNDKIITLSTCSYEYDEARYILIGKIVEQI